MEKLYSRNKKVCGIYIIQNIKNLKVYVGYSSDLYTREIKHLGDLRKGIHTNTHLQNAWNKEGSANFKFLVIEYCNKEELAVREDYWCKILRSNDREYGYNLAETDAKANTFNHSEETKKKISNKNKGRKRIDNCWLGKRHSLESREKMRLSKLGRKRALHTEETKQKMRESYLKRREVKIG